MRYQTTVTLTVDATSEESAARRVRDLVSQAHNVAGYGVYGFEFEVGETTVAPEPERKAYTVMLTDAEHDRAVAQYGNVLVPVTEANAE